MIIQVNDRHGRFIGFSTITFDVMCKACGQAFTAHGGTAWVDADNGDHITCNLKGR